MTRFAAIGVLLLLSGANVLAQGPPQVPWQKLKAANAHSPCIPEFQRFCKGVIPGNGHLLDCLDKHKPQLVPACRTRLELIDKMRVQGKINEKIAIERAKQMGAIPKDQPAAPKPK